MSISDELLLKLIYQEENKEALTQATERLDKMTEAEKQAMIAADKQAKSTISLKGTMTELKAGLDVAGMAVGYLGKAYNALVGDTIAYAGTVKDLALNLSLTTEETSKLISVGSKFGVSNDAITNALQMMVKRGMAPSLDGLAKMSDEMMAIQDPVKRSAALTEIFGRNWTALMPILEKGGAAIKAAGVEAEKFGLVLSQKDTDAVENLEISMNTLTMKVDGLKTKIGTALIPVLNDAADGLTRVVGLVSNATTTSEQYEKAIAAMAIAHGADSEEVKTLSEAYRNYLWIQQNAVTMTDANDRATQRQAASLSTVIPLTKEQAAGMRAYAEATQVGGQSQQDFNKWLGEEMNSAAAAALSMKELTTQTIYNTAATGLDANAALVLAEKMGLVDDGALGAAKAIQSLKDDFKAGKGTAEDYAASIIRIQDAIAGLKDKNVTITLETIQKEIRQQQNEQLRDEYGHLRAAGGAVSAGVPYIIGEHGREQYIPQQAGIVIPSSTYYDQRVTNITTDRLGVALAMARAQQMAAEARM